MDYRKLVCTKAQAEKLVELGITCASAFFYSDSCADKTKVFPITEAEEWDGTPAWTKEELDTMLGPGIIKPDFQTPKHNSKASDPMTYPVYFPTVQHTFKTGAQASACALIYLLERSKIDPEECAQRYYKIFS